MARYRATFNTNIEITVEIESDLDEIEAEDYVGEEAWNVAEAYLTTLNTQRSDARIVAVEASLDGIGADKIEVAS